MNILYRALLLSSLEALVAGTTVVGAGGGNSPAILVWDLANNSAPHVFRKPSLNLSHSEFVSSLLTHPNGSLLVGQLSGTVDLFDVKSETRIGSLSHPEASAVRAMSFLNNTQHLAVADSTGIVLYDVTASEPIKRLKLSGIAQMATMQDRFVVVGLTSGRVYVISLAQETALQLNGTHNATVRSVVVVSNTLVASCSDDGVFLHPVYRNATLLFNGNTSALVVFPTGHLISGSEDGKVRIWNITATDPLQVASTLNNGGAVYALSVVGTTMLASTGEEGIKVWELSPVRALLQLNIKDVWHVASVEVDFPAVTLEPPPPIILTPSPTESQPAPNTDTESISSVLMLCIGGGAVAAVCLIAILLVFCIRRRRYGKDDERGYRADHDTPQDKHVRWGNTEQSVFAERMALLMIPLNQPGGEIQQGQQESSMDMSVTAKSGCTEPVGGGLDIAADAPTIEVDSGSCENPSPLADATETLFMGDPGIGGGGGGGVALDMSLSASYISTRSPLVAQGTAVSTASPLSPVGVEL